MYLTLVSFYLFKIIMSKFYNIYFSTQVKQYVKIYIFIKLNIKLKNSHLYHTINLFDLSINSLKFTIVFLLYFA